MPNLTTLTINFYGIPLSVRGTYVPADPSVGLGSDFELFDVRAKIKWPEPPGQCLGSLIDLETRVYDYIRTVALELIEEGFDRDAIARMC